MKTLDIFYIYYHSYEEMPIHVSDVVEELVNQNHNITLITAIKWSFVRTFIWLNKINLINIPVINIRLLHRFCYSLLLMILLPVLCLKRQPDIIYERASMSTVITAVISKLMGIPLIVEVNGLVTEELKLGGESPLRIKVVQWCESFYLKYSSLIISVTRDIREWLIKTYRIDPHKVDVVTNGTNTRRFNPKNPKEARGHFQLEAEGRLYVGYLGTLSPWCGVELLIQCAPKVLEEFPQVEFLIGGGEQPYLGNLKHKAENRGLQNHFRFFGTIPWSEAPFFISTFDIAILSVVPLASGTSPQKLYAYLACNKPVIGSDTGEVGEVLKSHNLGLTFTPGDYESMGKSIIELLKDSKLRNDIAQRGHQVVAHTNSWTVKVNHLEKIIRRKVLHDNLL
jgi:glycosyltransferase involved in cell wall biosynthesis